MKIVTFQLEDLTCPSCIERIKKALTNQKGVQKAVVMFSSSRVRVNYDEKVIGSDVIEKTILNLGYKILN